MSGQQEISKSLSSGARDVAAQWGGRICELDAPAKLNLRLKVEGRRADGYHLLSMVNCSTSLRDVLRLTLIQTPDVDVAVEPPNFIKDPSADNLVARAFRAFWNVFGWNEPPIGLRCEIRKRIPVGGGLGGGSADAGCVLRYLEGIFAKFLCDALSLSAPEVRSRVMRAALACGADVPYSVQGGLCWVGGIGEEVLPVMHQDIAETDALLVFPPQSISTQEFYSRFRSEHPTLANHQDHLGRQVIKQRVDLWDLVENDFEATACGMAPIIGDLLRLMRSVFPRGTALTGSGSTIFSLIREGEGGAASELSATLESLGAKTFLASLVSAPS